MDEQNRVEDIDRVDGRSTSEQKKAVMAEQSQAQNGQGVQSVQAPYSQVAQPAQSLYQHMPQYGQPVQQSYQPQSQYGQPAQQPYQPQSQYIQGAQPMQTPYQQMPQYGQPTQHPYQPQSQYGQPTQQPYQPQSQYGQPVQPTRKMRTGNISFLLWFLREFIVCHLSLFWMLFTSSLQIAHILSHSFIFDKSAFRDVFLEE